MARMTSRETAVTVRTTRARATLVVLAAALAACATRSEPPQTPASATPQSAQVTQADKAADERTSNETTRGLGWILVGGGTVAGAVALGTSIFMLYNGSVRSSECNDQHVCSAKGVEANTQLSSLGGWNLGAWIVTAAAIGGGVFLLLTHPANEANAQAGSTSVGVTQTGSGSGIGLRSTF